MGCPDSLLAVVANLLALTPGTMTVRIETDTPTLYVHVLIFRDIETVRGKIEDLNRLVVLAFAGKDECAHLPRGDPVIVAAFVVLACAAACFFVRLVIGPSLSDRVVAIDGLLVVGVSAIGVGGGAHRRRVIPPCSPGGDARGLPQHRGRGALHRGA